MVWVREGGGQDSGCPPHSSPRAWCTGMGLLAHLMCPDLEEFSWDQLSWCPPSPLPPRWQLNKERPFRAPAPAKGPSLTSRMPPFCPPIWRSASSEPLGVKKPRKRSAGGREPCGRETRTTRSPAGAGRFPQNKMGPSHHVALFQKWGSSPQQSLMSPMHVSCDHPSIPSWHPHAPRQRPPFLTGHPIPSTVLTWCLASPVPGSVLWVMGAALSAGGHTGRVGAACSGPTPAPRAPEPPAPLHPAPGLPADSGDGSVGWWPCAPAVRFSG